MSTGGVPGVIVGVAIPVKKRVNVCAHSAMYPASFTLSK